MKLPVAWIAFTGAVMMYAGPPPPPQIERDMKTRIVLDVTRVDVLLTVTDNKGRFITDLTGDQFEITEDGRPQKLLGFSTRTELPLRLAILLDASNSMRERFRFVQEAAIDFITGVMRPGKDKAALMSFDSLVQQLAQLKDDPEELANAIRELHPGGGTSLYDAIHFACREKLPIEQPLHDYRRAIIVLSDGEDTQSHNTRDMALEMAQRSGVVIYAISTTADRLETHGDKVLKYLVQETGGLAFFPFKLEDLGKSFKQLANELRNQYNLYYRPEPLRTDGRFHKIDVRVKGRKDYVIRARKGYYAPKL